MHLHNYFQTTQSTLLQTFYQSNWSWKVNGRLQFRISLTHHCTKISKRESLCFLIKKLPWSAELFYLEPGRYPPLRILLKPWTLSFNKETITAKTLSQLKCLEEPKKLRFILQMRDLFLHPFVRTWDTFLVAMLGLDLESCWKKKELTRQNLFTTLSA